MTDPVASVIIVNFNSGGRLARCLAALAAQTRRDFETIVIDNQSSDGSERSARDPTVRLVEAGSNLGFAAANNRAAEGAKGDWLIFLNPDAYPEPDWFARLLEGARRYPFADAFGSAQLDAKDPARLDGAGDVMHVLGIAYRGGFGWPAASLPPDGECFAPCAAAAMYRRARFIALGGFDERFFCYGEDVDLGFRLQLAGGRAVQLAGARVLHEGSGVTGRYSDFTVYHGNRNRIWLTYKNMPAEIYWPLAPLRLLVDLYLLARAFSAGVGRSYWRALRDGYGRLPEFADARRDIQKSRKAGLARIASMLAWSPHYVSRRAPRLAPVADGAR